MLTDHQPPIKPDDQDPVDEVCQRFSDLLADHLDLESVLLAVAAHAAGRDPVDILDDIVRQYLAG